MMARVVGVLFQKENLKKIAIKIMKLFRRSHLELPPWVRSLFMKQQIGAPNEEGASSDEIES